MVTFMLYIKSSGNIFKFLKDALLRDSCKGYVCLLIIYNMKKIIVKHFKWTDG